MPSRRGQSPVSSRRGQPSAKDSSKSASKQAESQNFSSLLFSNPLDTLKRELSPSGMAMTSFWAWRSGGEVFTFAPWTFTPSFLFRGAIGDVAKGYKLSPLAREVTTALLGGGFRIGGKEGLAKLTGRAAFTKDAGKAFTKAIKKVASSGGKEIDDAVNFVASKVGPKLSGSKMPGILTEAGSMSPKFSKLVNRSVGFTRAGATLTALSTGYIVGSMAARGAELAFKAARGAVEFASAKVEQARALEFGGTMGDGFKTNAAVQERQRAMEFLKRTHIPGRRGLGDEGAEYSQVV